MLNIKHINPGRPNFILLLFLTILPFGYLSSQNVGSPVSSDNVRLELDKLLGADQRLISGDFYDGAPLGSVNGHPYFFDEMWNEGSVVIGSIKYEDLILKFDIAANSVVLKTYALKDNVIQLCLKKEKISEFTMNKVKFTRFPDKGINNKIIFAQLCEEGSVDFLLVRSKELVLSEGGTTDFKYKEYYHNYLRYNGQILKFKSKKTLFNLFPEYKTELKRYLSQHNLSTKRKETTNRAKLVNYCNSLLSSPK
ncbi:hypothetical protein [Maribellus maritimus]|uniref:hypothetical protein n=1 Tax=Maribellus maritimus TaxID=2870838 RepID=UPI001EEBC921|nr:hypothetical protein [Maribellus maritimus]MCG6189280.1 hypothetical protein [Maribellus maritimus]